MRCILVFYLLNTIQASLSNVAFFHQSPGLKQSWELNSYKSSDERQEKNGFLKTRSKSLFQYNNLNLELKGF